MDSETLHRFVDLIVILVLLFLIPVFYNSLINDSSINTYILREVDLFGDQVCKNGYVSVSMYEDLLDKLAATDLLYDIKMVHTHDVYYPSADGSQTEEQTTYEKDIKGQLYANDFRALTKYDKGDYVYGTDGILYEYIGSPNIYPHDPALVGDFDPVTGASHAYPYWERVGSSIKGMYLMKDGDRFSITVSNRSDTTSQKVSTLLSMGKTSGIHAYGGGTVVDENY